MAYDAAFRYDWTRGGFNLLGNTTQQYEDHMFPLSVIGRGGWELPNWVQGYEAYWRNKAAAAQESGDASDADALPVDVQRNTAPSTWAVPAAP